VHIFKIEKSNGAARLELYDDKDCSLVLIESESFPDLYTLNFHLQTLATKYHTLGGILVVHDKTVNTVELLLANDENSLFVS
jgi:hypothetical protein